MRCAVVTDTHVAMAGPLRAVLVLADQYSRLTPWGILGLRLIADGEMGSHTIISALRPDQPPPPPPSRLQLARWMDSPPGIQGQ